MTALEAIGRLYLAVNFGEGIDMVEMREIQKTLPMIESDDPDDALDEVLDYLAEHGLGSL
jgi:hypothetical protein